MIAAMGGSVVAAPVADPIEPMRLDGLPDLKMVSVPWQALSFDFGNPKQSLASRRTVDVPLKISSEEVTHQAIHRLTCCLPVYSQPVVCASRSVSMQ